MQYTGYVAEINDDADAYELDFESTDYCETDAALASAERIRLEWMEGDEFWAVTINHFFETDDGRCGTGTLECNFPSWEGRRSIQKRETGRVDAVFISNDVENDVHELRGFWIDVRWTTGLESGRLLFELEGHPE